MRSTWEVELRKLGVGGEERGGAQEGPRVSHSLRWKHRGTDLEGRSRRLLDTWVCSSGEMKPEGKVEHLECQLRHGN